MTVEKLLRYIILAGLLYMLLMSVIAFEEARADTHMEETRYCGQPVRDADGRIVRAYAVYTAFRSVHPCPSSGLTNGPCFGWQVNHVIPLACGGCDAVSNMEWMRNDVKKLHDGYERKLYGLNIPDTANCSSPPPGGIK
jgi:hypothetical protein